MLDETQFCDPNGEYHQNGARKSAHQNEPEFQMIDIMLV